MASKKNRIPKDGPVFTMTSEEATLSKMPKYNAFAGGYGTHGDSKYNRNKEKREFERRMRDDD